MIIEKIKTDSLAHLSYLIIDGEEAFVIDPCRHAKDYLKKAKSHNATIKYIFETHRNEDLVTGSRELKRYCGAKIFHGEGLDFEYGEFVRDGEEFTVGSMSAKILSTPGHTPESISIALYPKGNKDAVAVFTGDALFVNDVGRTDFFPDRMDEFAGMLYDSIFEKILPLGDQVVLYPAHGAGSVCGGGIADREVSTLGFEKKNNPMLQLSREDFIQKKVNETHQKPPYFKKMEELNLTGAEAPLRNYDQIELMSVAAFKQSFESAQALDVRSPEAFLGCHIPKTLNIPLDMLGAYAGYFLDYQNNILLIADNYEQASHAKKTLEILGYDNQINLLTKGMLAWETSGEEIESTEIISAKAVINQRDELNLIDVRKPNEWNEGVIEGAKKVFLGDLKKALDDLNPEKSYTLYCGSGKRATIAASLMQANGFKNVKVFMGSMAAYRKLQ